MAELTCPMCGKPNPAERDTCQYCEARLKPLTDELSRSQPPIRPGEEPKEMDTGQLEPILPQWLRDIRQQARESAKEDAAQVPAREEPVQPVQPEEPADLLAGLRSQSDADDEVPDWLTDLRGEGGQTGFEETSASEEDDLDALKRLLGEDAPVPQGSEESALPGWISDLGAEDAGQADEGEPFSFSQDATEQPAQSETQFPASDSDFGWRADFEVDSGFQAAPTDEAAFDTDLPSWLQGTEAASKDEGEGGLPAWMQTEEESQPAQQETEIQPASESGLPDWLSSLGEEDAGASAPPQFESQPEAQDTPDWLASLGKEGTEEAAPPQFGEQPEARGTTDWLSSLGGTKEESPSSQSGEQAEAQDATDWLSSLGSEAAGETHQPPAADEFESTGTTDWLSSLGAESSQDASQQAFVPSDAEGETPAWLTSSAEESPAADAQQEFGEPAAASGDMPDWLASLGSQDFAAEEQPAAAAPFTETSQPEAEEDVPDWLSSMGTETAEVEQPFEQVEPSAPAMEEPAETPRSAPAFIDDEGKPISSEDVDALFSMDMPDWLSESGGGIGGEASAAMQDDELRPAELPSWVQAMKPVESVISETGGETPEEQPLEEQGPLAGLRGVLPAVPGVGPSSKPKAYSIKLQASQDQQANASMLERMLAEEITPLPVTTQKLVRTQRPLRWVIALLLLLVVAGAVFGNFQISPMPTSAPLETSAALKYIQDTLPADAPVLLIFDYEAALAGELEAAATPLIDHMLILKHPRLGLISSTPVGTGLAERFMTYVQSAHNYQRNQQFVNLGYLPGSASGVQAFSKNPGNTKPLTTGGEDAWTTPVLQGVTNLSDFEAIILLTDDVESARIWIEQTETARGDASLLVVSSAQSGPMILPYARSGQVDGMVTGLDGSAPIELVNSGRPGMVRRYWDAYGFGLLTAVVLIVLGSLWSLVTGLQALRKGQVEE